ncbi:UNVERIFIED_CONTAM: movement protein [Sesamum calycinum]|uniref:Movement protein n=1 Tax=Sesamum calycinum TaxID=2727403 RepID=A0AAW2P9J0_9LAMI
MLIQSYKVPEGQMDSVARRLSFLKDKLKDWCYQTSIQKNMRRLRGNLYAGKLMFDIHPRIAYNLANQDFSRVLTLHQDFKRKDFMKEENRPYSITYRIAYALSNTHHSNVFLRKEYVEIPRIFKKFAKDHGYKEKEKELLKALTPREIRLDNPVVDRYEGMLEIVGHEILIASVAGRETRSSRICIAKPGVFPEEARETLPIVERDFSQKLLILNMGIRDAKIMIGGAFGIPWFRDKRKFGKVLMSFRKHGLIDSYSFYEEYEEEIKNHKDEGSGSAWEARRKRE